MRRTRHGVVVVLAAAALASGCQYLLGISDPVVADGIDAAGGCVRSPCDLAGSCGCPSGDTCSSARGEACNQDTDCQAGALCLVNVCRKPCLISGDCGATRCLSNFDPLLPALVCTEACTPVSNAGCPASDTCVPLQGADGAFCIPGETIPVGTSCVDHAFSCVTGAICYHDPSGATVDTCRAVCDPTGGAPCAGSCTAAPDLTVGGHNYGLCP
jgi:hypothetical protein